MSRLPAGYSLGFDASSHQVVLDRSKILPHIEYAIFRTNYGTYVDPKFENHVETLPALVQIAAAAPSTIARYKDWSAAGWTSSGNKRIIFLLIYEW